MTAYLLQVATAELTASVRLCRLISDQRRMEIRIRLIRPGRIHRKTHGRERVLKTRVGIGDTDFSDLAMFPHRVIYDLIDFAGKR